MTCPKCRRYQLYEERDHWGSYLTCLACGFVLEEPQAASAPGALRRTKNLQRKGVRL